MAQSDAFMDLLPAMPSQGQGQNSSPGLQSIPLQSVPVQSANQGLLDFILRLAVLHAHHQQSKQPTNGKQQPQDSKSLLDFLFGGG